MKKVLGSVTITVLLGFILSTSVASAAPAAQPAKDALANPDAYLFVDVAGLWKVAEMSSARLLALDLVRNNAELKTLIENAVPGARKEINDLAMAFLQVPLMDILQTVTVSVRSEGATPRVLLVARGKPGFSPIVRMLDGMGQKQVINGKDMIFTDGLAIHVSDSYVVFGDEASVREALGVKNLAAGALTGVAKTAHSSGAFLAMGYRKAVFGASPDLLDEIAEDVPIVRDIEEAAWSVGAAGFKASVLCSSDQSTMVMADLMRGANAWLGAAGPVIEGLGYIASAVVTMYPREFEPELVAFLSNRKAVVDAATTIAKAAALKGNVKQSGRNVEWTVKGDPFGMVMIMGAGVATFWLLATQPYYYEEPYYKKEEAVPLEGGTGGGNNIMAPQPTPVEIPPQPEEEDEE